MLQSPIVQIARLRVHSLPALRDDLFEALAESAPDAIVTIDAQSRILFANSAVTRIFGYSNEELLGASLQLLIPERLRAAHAAGIARYLQSGERRIPWTGVSLPAVTRDGSEIPVEISFGELAAADGSRIFSGFIRDMSERERQRREIEAARHEAETALRELRALHSITDAALAQSDYESMLRELLGRLRAELTADSSALLLLDGKREHLVVRATDGLSERLEGLVVLMGKGIAGRVAQGNRSMILDDVRTIPDVHPVLNESIRSVAAVPIRMENDVIGVVQVGSREERKFAQADMRLLEVVADRMAGVIARTRLYEAQQRAQEELRRAYDELEHRASEELALRTVAQRVAAALSIGELMQQIADGALAVSGAVGALVEQVVGPESSEVEIVAVAGEGTPPVGTRVAFPGSLTEEIIFMRDPAFFLGMKGAGASMAPYLARHCPGCSVLVIPLLGKNVALGAIVLVRRREDPHFSPAVVNRMRTLSDLASIALQRLLTLGESERRRAEAEAAVRSRDEVLSIVSHDLRNPVNTIAMSAQLLKDPEITLSDEQQSTTLDIVLRSAHRMNRLIEDLLDVARIEGGRFTVSCRCEDPASLAAEACDAFRPIIASRDITLECEHGEGMPSIYVDRDRVLQVLSNYLSNAAKFTAEQGTIRLAVASSRGEVRFTVTDNGPGIPESDLPRVFSRFWQATRTSHLGAGLGLAIAKGIADVHKGRVWVESETGKGSTFGLAIPVSAECN